MSSKKYKKTTNNLKLNNTCIFIIIGFLLTFLFGEFTIKQEYQMILKTYLSLFLIGLSTFPMTYKINNFFREKGYFISKSIGILINAFIVFLIASLDLLKYEVKEK